MLREYKEFVENTISKICLGDGGMTVSGKEEEKLSISAQIAKQTPYMTVLLLLNISMNVHESLYRKEKLISNSSSNNIEATLAALLAMVRDGNIPTSIYSFQTRTAGAI